MSEKNCKDCVNLNDCYLICVDWHRYPNTIPDYFNAIRQRDICVNNNKCDYKQKVEAQ